MLSVKNSFSTSIFKKRVKLPEQRIILVLVTKNPNKTATIFKQEVLATVRIDFLDKKSLPFYDKSVSNTDICNYFDPFIIHKILVLPFAVAFVAAFDSQCIALLGFVRARRSATKQSSS
ncbi:MAG: hypothetical protein ACXWTP_03300 [Methylosarcina sp.]